MHAVVGFLLHMIPWFFARLTDKKTGDEEGRHWAQWFIDLPYLWAVCIVVCMNRPLPPSPPPPRLVIMLFVFTVQSCFSVCEPALFWFSVDFDAWRLLCFGIHFDGDYFPVNTRTLMLEDCFGIHFDGDYFPVNARTLMHENEFAVRNSCDAWKLFHLDLDFDEWKAFVHEKHIASIASLYALFYKSCDVHTVVTLGK